VAEDLVICDGQFQDNAAMSEIELMRSVATGDRVAIQTLLDAHYDPIFRLLRHLTGRKEDAEDLTQDVFLVARSKGGSFAGEGSIRSWLARIAINAELKLRRRERLRQICHLAPVKTRDEVEAALDSEWLLGAISKLPKDQQLALLLHDVHGYSVRELSVIAQCPEGTVKARLHYARKKVQELLDCPNEDI
jgi:RNA polymerase sigma-70 factor (ECF subfamily)